MARQLRDVRVSIETERNCRELLGAADAPIECTVPIFRSKPALVGPGVYPVSAATAESMRRKLR